MKIAVVNYSGNVGKTMLSKHVLTPKLNARRITVESINSGAEGADAEIKANQYQDLALDLSIADDDDNYVVDIGSSNIEAVIQQLRSMEGSSGDFDYFVLPVTPDAKQQIDTLATINTLTGLGVGKDKIAIILNRVTDISAIENDFAAVIAGAKTGMYRLVAVPVLESDVYDRTKGLAESIPELAADATDYRALAHAEVDRIKRLDLGHKLITQRMARSAAANLDEVWAALALQA